MNSNENQKKILNIGLVIMLVIGVLFVIFTLNLNNNKQEEYNSDDNIQQDTNGNQQLEEDKKPLDETAQEQKPLPEENADKEQETATSPTSLKCTKTVNNKYGKFVYTNTYKFKSGKMVTGTIRIEATLKKSYRNYRDSLIKSLKDENSKFIKLSGIKESVSKRSDGFTYTFKLNVNKLSKKALSELGYNTLNYSGVKIEAYNHSYKCTQ